ncbi:MAG: WecB/TagA/CpsF family glycosyltransferase [Candidatus Kerfeldbacteria bacterium]|nr:WecB/TagA/CpsF family glycosyltransferase [Candidatus Kerfeldbacteria bacterium]
MRFSILGVPVDNLTVVELKERVRQLGDDRLPHHIVTVNPEFIMAAQHDTEFRSILNRADLSVADGFGISLAARRLGQRLQGRWTGVDMMIFLCELAASQNRSVFLLGAQPGVAEKTAAELHRRFPGLHIVGAESGFRHWHRPFPLEKIIDQINRKRPDYLFVAFGQVKQEKWIYQALPKLNSVKIAVGVGGAFDYVSGKIRRAPRWMRAVGLEWLFRLFRQPWRASRIFTAVVRFGLTVLRSAHHHSS